MSDNQLKTIIARILRLHAEEDEIKADRREVYAEAKANGYDKTALGAAVATIRKRDKVGEEAIAERDAIVSLYVSAYDSASHTYAYERAHEATEHPAAQSMPERDPQSGHHGSDSEGGKGGDSPDIKPGSEQGSADEPQARNEPGSEEAASGGERVAPLPETRAISSLAKACAIAAAAGGTQNTAPVRNGEMPDLPAFLDRRPKPQAVA